MGLFNGWFGTRWYGMLYRHRDERDAAALARSVVDRGGLSPGMSLLDMGCGRGRHAAFFLARGLRVTGIDLSRACIRQAMAAHPLAHFAVHDMREPYATDAFDAVVCLFTSLGYTEDRKDDERAVAAARTALKPGGLFVLDLMNGAVVAQSLVPLEVIEMEGATFTIERAREGDGIVKRIAVEHAGGRHEFQERVHAWNPDEVHGMVTRCGLAVVETTAGNGTDQFDPDSSDRMVVWARKNT